MSVLSVENLSVSLGERALVREVSFSLEAGKTLALVGESGSGKSLTALSLLRLLPKAMDMRGVVTLEGKVLADVKEARGCRVGMIFQEPLTALNPLHTIGAQIAEMIRVHKPLLGKAEVRARVVELLGQVGLEMLESRLSAYPHELSGGQRQRVMIAMAIANDPALLIADEPTTALDVTVQKQILELLKRLQAERGMGLLLITHDLTLVRRYADRVAVMQEGEIVEQAVVEALFAAPKHPYTKFLLEAEPKGRNTHTPGAEVVMAGSGITVRFPKKTGFWGGVKEEQTAVEDVSVVVHRGETVGIVGESGSGKTTLALALLRLVKASGEIRFEERRLDGVAARELRPLRQRMQLVFQDPFSSLNPRLTVEDIVVEGLRVHQPGLSAEERGVQTAAALEDVGLPPDILGRYPHEFSGGQRQRIALARALILRPSLLVLDEPTSALDLATQAHIIELLRRLQEERDLSYVFISHDLRVIRAIAHRIVVLKEGKVVEQGSVQEIFAAPKQGYTQALLQAAFPSVG